MINKMKAKKTIITTLVVIGVTTTMAVRLLSNKASLDNELQMVSHHNPAIPVVVDTVKLRAIQSDFSVRGDFEAVQQLTLTAGVDGNLMALNVREGQQVSKGSVMALLDTTLYASKLELAKYNLQKAEKDFQRHEKLIKTDGVTMQQVESARQTLADARAALVDAGNNYQNAIVRAPFSGVVTQKYYEKGTLVSAGSNLFDLNAVQQLKLVIKLTALEITNVHMGQSVTISTELYPNETLTGTVYSINIKPDAAKRYTVEVITENPSDRPINPGVSGVAMFQSTEAGSSLMISQKALIGSIKDAAVYVVKSDSVVVQSITALPLDGKNLLVQSGVNEGDIIVVSGQMNLTNGSKIKIQ